MNIEEKAKAYDEAFERARKIHEYSSDLAEIKRMEHIFPELAESEDERIRKDIINTIERYIEHVENENCVPDAKDFLIKELKGQIDWLEKQGQKSADKVEPKFHEGDWVIGRVTDNEPRQIAEITEEGYKTTYDGWIGFSFEEDIHLWSIQDARDGDVLFAENFDNIGGCVFLFKGLDSWRFDAEGDRAIATSYCCTSITESGSTDFGIQGPDCVEIKRVHPATKEQRDTLMKEMTDAGYMWDSEKKEVMKIEQKSTDTNFSDLTTWKYIVDAVLTKEHGVGNYLDNPNTEKFAKELQERFGSVEQKPTECIKFSNGFENQVSNLLVSVLNGEHEYNEGFVKYVAQSLLGCAKNELKPTAWSEEDEKMFNSALWHIKNSCSNGGKNSGEFEVYNWVKSVKQRIGGRRYESKGNR